MTATTITEQISTTYEIISCGECDIRWAMSATFLSQRRQDGEGFYCPNGHCRAYAKSEVDRLKEQLRKEQARLAEWREAYAERSAAAETEKRAHAATKGQLTKTRNRIAKGVCPDCHRTFADLARHMARHAATTPAEIHALNEREKAAAVPA